MASALLLFWRWERQLLFVFIVVLLGGAGCWEKEDNKYNKYNGIRALVVLKKRKTIIIVFIVVLPVEDVAQEPPEEDRD